MKAIPINALMLGLLSCSLLAACGSDDDKEIPANMAPMVETLSLTTLTETPVSDAIMAMDKEGDALTFTIASQPSLGMVSLMADGSFTYTPANEATGMDSFNVSVSDGINAAVIARVNINIDSQQLSFSSLSRDAFTQGVNAEPLRLNGRTVDNDVTTTDFYDDLLVGQ